MAVACEGIACPSDQTCVAGACRPATIDDSSRCLGGGCGDEVLGGQGAADAGKIDATIQPDASTDAPLDAAIHAPPTHAAVEGATLPSLAGFALGQRASCAIMADKTVRCWGSNGAGKLGNGDPDAETYAFVPQPVPGLDHVSQLAAGESHFCALMEDGGV